MKACQQAFFILIFMKEGADESNFYQFLWNSDKGDPWVSLPAQEDDRPPQQAPGQHAPRSTCAPAHAHRGESRVGVGHRTCRKLSLVPQNSCFYLFLWAKRPSLPNQVQPPCSITAVNLLIASLVCRRYEIFMKRWHERLHSLVINTDIRVCPQGTASTEIRCPECISAHMVQSDE